MHAVGCVIASRNRPESAAHAARSALAQTYPLAEIVVVDDASAPPLALPDDLAQDPRVRLVRLPDGVGRGAARNAGLAALSTPLVAFLDDDDVWHPDKTRLQLGALESLGERTAAVGTGFRLWSAQDCVVVRPPARCEPAYLLRDFGVCTSTVLARREAVLDAGGFAEDLDRCEDWDLWIRLADACDIAGMPEVLVEREDSRPSALELHDAWIAIRARLAPRIARLQPAARASIEAEHDFMEAIHKARLGRRRAAAALLLRAWRGDPRRVRRLAHLGRLLTGERLWERAALIIRRRRRQALDHGARELLRPQSEMRQDGRSDIDEPSPRVAELG